MGENYLNAAQMEPRERSAAVSQTSRSNLAGAATGFQHICAPLQGEGGYSVLGPRLVTVLLAAIVLGSVFILAVCERSFHLRHIDH